MPRSNLPLHPAFINLAAAVSGEIPVRDAEGTDVGHPEEFEYGDILAVRSERTRIKGQTVYLTRYFVRWHGRKGWDGIDSASIWHDSSDIRIVPRSEIPSISGDKSSEPSRESGAA
jgi:hypothetical protein